MKIVRQDVSIPERERDPYSRKYCVECGFESENLIVYGEEDIWDYGQGPCYVCYTCLEKGFQLITNDNQSINAPSHK